MPRFYCPTALASGMELDLPAAAARHVQVLRLQPGDGITLFNQGPGWDSAGCGAGEFEARIVHMGRSSVTVQVGEHHAVEREAAAALHLAIGMPANERMDWLVEKATELGVASIQPLMSERTVVRLDASRAAKRQGHLQGIAIAACEQCGRNRVPEVYLPLTLAQWMQQPRASDMQRLLLSLQPPVRHLRDMALVAGQPVLLACGPEGGLGPSEEAALLGSGFTPVTLGARVLRSETAALAALALLS